MSDDLLEQATKALRDETSAPELRSGLTRARMLDAASRQHGRSSRVRWLAPLLMLGTSTALAHVTHQYFPAAWNAVVPAALERRVAQDQHVHARRPRASEAPRSEPPSAAATVTQPAPVVEAPAATATTPEIAITQAARRDAVPEPATLQPKPRKARAEPARGALPALNEAPEPREVTPAIVTEDPALMPRSESAELTLFRRAMKLHDARDHGAIRAWDDFLRVAAGSPLAPEARYNRALGLVRERRVHEARAALEPFARGDFGGYRKHEATALLQALEHRDGGTGSK